MTKTITRIWYSDLEPMTYSGLDNNEIRHLARQQDQDHQRLNASLDDRGKELFQKYIESSYRYRDTLNEQAFCSGFCLGAKITAEALIGAEEIN